jgi:hypothetical protein
VGEHVFLKVKEKKKFAIRLGIFPNLETRYCGPFEISEKREPVAYMLTFPTSMRVHNVFHVSLLNKYVVGPNDIIYWTMIQVEHKGDFRVILVPIMDQKVKVLRKKSIRMVKV